MSRTYNFAAKFKTILKGGAKIMGAAGNKKNKPKNKHVPSYQQEEALEPKEPHNKKHEFTK